jgi:pimeloyl-ACP methyl ester carboxylesterase
MPATMSHSPSPRLEIAETGNGPHRVVFVHGVLDQGRSFGRVARLLAAECQMVWYDRRGYGGSVDAAGAPVGVDGHVDDLLEVLDGRRAVVVGHSFGGVTALGAALRAPELVGAVVLYETGMAWLPGWDDRVLRALLWGEDPEGEGVRLMFRDRVGRMTVKEHDARRREARAFVAEERSVRTGAEPFDVAALRQPLVFGHSDTYPFGAVVDHLRTVVPRVEVIELPGAGHNAHRSQPGPFANLVRRGIALAGD